MLWKLHIAAVEALLIPAVLLGLAQKADVAVPRYAGPAQRHCHVRCCAPVGMHKLTMWLAMLLSKPPCMCCLPDAAALLYVFWHTSKSAVHDHYLVAGRHEVTGG